MTSSGTDFLTPYQSLDDRPSTCHRRWLYRTVEFRSDQDLSCFSSRRMSLSLSHIVHSSLSLLRKDPNINAQKHIPSPRAILGSISNHGTITLYSPTTPSLVVLFADTTFGSCSDLLGSSLSSSPSSSPSVSFELGSRRGKILPRKELLLFRLLDEGRLDDAVDLESDFDAKEKMEDRRRRRRWRRVLLIFTVKGLGRVSPTSRKGGMEFDQGLTCCC